MDGTGLEGSCCWAGEAPLWARLGDGDDEEEGASGATMGEPTRESLPSAAPPEATMMMKKKQQGVKRHHHKHNLKHRYELQETLGKGTYGKVKRATERFSGRVVRKGARGSGTGGGVGARPPRMGGSSKLHALSLQGRAEEDALKRDWHNAFRKKWQGYA